MRKIKAVSSKETYEQKDDKSEQVELTQREIEQQDASELPDREAMSLINANLAAPVNLAAALNVLSDSSTAYANAEQAANIEQTQ